MRKRVLFLTIDFYEYVDQIYKHIQKLNMDVDKFILTHENKYIGYLINKVTKGKLNNCINKKRQTEFFNNINNIQYDFIFVLVGRGIDVKLFRKFIGNQKKAKRILYLWDDIKRVDTFNQIRDSFDVIFSFDKNDCREYNLRFLPLFFCDQYIYKNEKKKYDFSIIGFLHSDREQVLNKILKLYPKNKYKWFGLLKTTRKHFLMTNLKRKSLKKNFYIKFKTLMMNENAEILKTSRITIDIQHPTQTGLTIRTFEAMAAHTKIITTNKEILNYDFYKPENIIVIDRNHPIIDENFVKGKFNEQINIDKYSINNWIKQIFMEEYE